MEDYKVLCITRHSMRGTFSFLNSQEIPLLNDIILPNPFIAWNQDLSCEGPSLINIEMIDSAVKDGFEQLKLGEWNKKWDEVRVDFLTQRTYLTGKLLKSKIKNKPKLTAVIDKKNPEKEFKYSNQNIDAVVYPVFPGDFPNQPPIIPTSITEEKMKENTRELLNWLNLALKDKPFIGNLPPVFINGNLNTFYSTNINLASDVIVMSSRPIPPLNKLYKSNKKYKYQKELVESCVKWTVYYLYNYFPLQYCIYQSLPVIQYLNKMDYNSAKILSSHDYNQLVLLRSLEIEPYPFDIPFQNYIIIQSKSDVCIMYVSQKICENGVISKNSYVKKMVWKGSIDDWNKKIQNMYSYIESKYTLYPIKQAYKLLIS